MISDVLNTNMNSNADVMDTSESSSRSVGIDEKDVTDSQMASAGGSLAPASVDEKGVTDSHMASAGEPLASAHVTSDVVEVPESRPSASITSDAPSSTEYVVSVSNRSRGVEEYLPPDLLEYMFKGCRF